MTQNSLKIAVTGGIGSGKSTVCEIIKKYGFPVYSCDQIYSELLNSSDFLKKIENEFGGVLNSDGSLNRKALSAAVFNNESALKKLNTITHPEIISAAFKKMEGSSIAFLEVPLLFENGLEDLFDGAIVVLRGIEDRINSVISRSNLTRDEVLLRINSQYNYNKLDFTKYYVIHNCGNFEDLDCKTRQILTKINTLI